MNDAFPRFSDAEFERRRGLARDLMRSNGLAALVVFGNSGINRHNEANVFWLSNYMDLHHSYLVFPLEGEPTLLVGLVNHVPNACHISVIADTRWGGYEPAAEIRAVLERCGIGRGRVGLVGVNATFGMGMPFQHYLTLSQEMKETEWVDVTREYARLRVVKSEEEFAWLKQAAHWTDLALFELEAKVRPGLSEYELVAMIESAYCGLGGQPHISFLASMPMDAPTACVPAQNVSGRVLERGDVIITEISASYWGYSGQIHRPIAVAQDPTPEWMRMFEVGVDAYERMCATIRPGATEGDVILAASVIGESGFRIYDDLIHGYGVDIHPPLIDRSCCQYWDGHTTPPPGRSFERDMAMVIQPNPITLDEKMGLQVGSLTRVTESGAVSLHEFSMRFIVAG